jgi:PAS domain-containing protein
MQHVKPFLEKYPTLGSFLPGSAQTLMLFSDHEGKILWANEAFLSWIGYSYSEFTRPDKPVTWKQISVPDASLDADIDMANRTYHGEMDSYVIRKFYIPKNQSPQFVELFVRRFPPTKDGSCELFVVEVLPLFNGHARIAKEYEETQQQLIVTLKEMNEKLDLMTRQGFNAVISWLIANKWAGIPTLIFLVYIVFGERAGEVFRNIIQSGIGK